MMPQERIHECIVEHIVVVFGPQNKEETIDVARKVPESENVAILEGDIKKLD